MPSSISSSNSRIPKCNYSNMWLLILMFVALFLCSFELRYRLQGHRPAVVDDPRFWSFHRADVYTSGNRKRLVVVGASRAQLGLVPDILKDSLPDYGVKHLAINGTPSFEVAKDLCLDPAFDGVILWSMTARSLAPAESEQKRNDSVYVRFFRNDFIESGSMNNNLNCIIGRFLQSHMVSLSSYLQPRKILATHFQPKPIYAGMEFSRYRPANYYSRMTPSELEEHRRWRLERRRQFRGRLDLSEFVQLIRNKIAPMRGLLRSRGGELILLRMPTSDEHWKMDEADSPKDIFWDQISKFSDVPTIHFRDYPELMTFNCPDTSHLDATDAPEFTRRLAPIIRSKIKANKRVRRDGTSL